MNIIQIIILVLLILPLQAIFTDFKEGKIKNYFIFPSLIFVLILSFFIEWFYTSSDNVLSLWIILFFSYLFYIHNKWGAWDGKYLILIWFSSIIIWYLKWIPWIIITLFIFIFWIFLIYTCFYLLTQYKGIKKITFKYPRFKIVDIVYTIFALKISTFFIVDYLPTQYTYLIVFVLMMTIMPYFERIKNRYFMVLIVFLGIVLTVISSSYISLTLIALIFILFKFLSSFIDQIFDIIDIKKIKIIQLTQWSILTQETIDKIKKDTGVELSLSPIQGLETYNIISYYKSIKKENDAITLYKDIKIWIIIYIGYFLTIITSLN